MKRVQRRVLAGMLGGVGVLVALASGCGGGGNGGTVTDNGIPVLTTPEIGSNPPPGPLPPPDPVVAAGIVGRWRVVSMSQGGVSINCPGQHNFKTGDFIACGGTDTYEFRADSSFTARTVNGRFETVGSYTLNGTALSGRLAQTSEDRNLSGSFEGDEITTPTGANAVFDSAAVDLQGNRMTITFPPRTRAATRQDMPFDEWEGQPRPDENTPRVIEFSRL